MKILINLLVILSMSIFTHPSLPRNPFIQANLLCWYQCSYLPDSSATTRRTEKMRLYCSAKGSKFVSNGTYLYDSLTAAATAPGTVFNGSDYGNKVVQLYQSSPTKFRFTVFKNFTQQQIIYFERVYTSLFTYQEKLPVCQWQLMPDRNIIAGYTCQRATTNYAGRTYNAWFTREIALSDGPYKFSGLPGLIIKVTDTRNNYSFELIRAISLKPSIAVALPEGKMREASKSAILRAREDFKSTQADLVGAGVKDLTAEDKAQMRARARRDNNSIELR